MNGCSGNRNLLLFFDEPDSVRSGNSAMRLIEAYGTFWGRRGKNWEAFSLIYAKSKSATIFGENANEPWKRLFREFGGDRMIMSMCIISNLNKNSGWIIGLILFATSLVINLVSCTIWHPGTADGTQGSVLIHPQTEPLPEGNGSAVPWTRYEAESCSTTGTVLSPNRLVGDPAGEASGRSAVKLLPGQSLTLAINDPACGIVVRYCIPDRGTGGGQSAQLDVVVDGNNRGSLFLDSKHAWLYGDEGSPTNNPGDGIPRRIYDEARLLTGAMGAGATLELSLPASAAVAYCVIDLVELENPVVLTQPAGSVSVANYGAVAGDGLDHSNAFRSAISAAGNGGTVWIPAGVYYLDSKIGVSGVTIQGAGMWFSELRCHDATNNQNDGNFGFTMSSDNTAFYDFSAFSNGIIRGNGGKFWSGSARNGTIIGRVWIEHVECAYWVTGGNNLFIFDSRFRNTYADTINLCNGVKDSEIRNCTARNSGDDGFAIWAATDANYSNGACERNLINHCTVENVWRAAGLAIYGGSNNRIEKCVVNDTLTYPGLTVSSEFSPFAFSGTTTVNGLTLNRCGGDFWSGQHFGAIWIYTCNSNVSGVQLANIDINDATNSGLYFQANGHSLSNASFSGITINKTGRAGIQVQGGMVGTANFDYVSISNAAGGNLVNAAGASFTLIKGTGNNW